MKLLESWPWVAASLFWFGGIHQIKEILEAQSAELVSTWFFASATVALTGYVMFYWHHMKDGTARLNALIVSAISAALYLYITILTVVF